ncbi:hypothetical protein LSCM1_06892 [Leishmania martiniquensis]|uniref:Uncharacterized protein n=1 Tax=Leishmania martiniquensis TaxID=1580590 RepID=A0A836HTY4_9TRYP|nr:hypothetical protein LSCM1_06892 [Leishmania martiniquensis]
MSLDSPRTSSASSEALLAACTAEAQQLRDALREVALREAGGAPGAVLEGKYLALVKTCKSLNVQLATTQQQLTAARNALQAEQEKTQRLAAAVKVSLLGARAAKTDSKSSARTAHLDGSGDNVGGSKSSGAEGSGGAAPASSAAVARVYDQLHLKEIAMAEMQRENAALRTLIQREVGLRDDKMDVDSLLRRAASALGSNGGSAATTVGSKAACGSDGGGWRGRAEEIVLLKGQLKDAQRELDKVAAAQGSHGGGEDDVETRTEPLSLPDSVRAFLGAGADPAAEARSVATTTTVQTRRPHHDVDDDARDRLNAMQQQRAAQLRQLTADLAQQQAQLNEERMKSSALQARVKTMSSELKTLRSYVDTILEKSSTDNELVEAYKTELKHAHEEAREWKRAAADALNRVRNDGDETRTTFTVSGMRNGLNHAAAATARLSPYRKAARDERAVDAGGDAAEKACGAQLSLPPSQLPKSFSSSLYEWVCQACDEAPQEVEQENTQPAVSASAKALAAVLRHAFQYALLVERHTATEAESALAGTDSNSAESVLLKENTALKKRIRAISELMEKELQAQRVLWAAANAGAKPSTVS